MKLETNLFKKFVDIVGINKDGFDATLENGTLMCNVINNDRNTVVVTELVGINSGETMNLRMHRDMIQKVLRSLGGKEIDFAASDEIVTITDGKTTLYVPQLLKVITEKTIKPLPKNSWEPEATISFNSSDIKHIIKVAENTGVLVVRFVITQKGVTVFLRQSANIKDFGHVTAYNSAEEKIEIAFHLGQIKDSFENIEGIINLNVGKLVGNSRPPSSFTHSSMGFLVSGLLSEWKEKNDS